MFVPSKSEQLLRDLAPHPALSRSGTQWLLSYSLIPLWFMLVLFAFPECNRICFTVLRSFPSPVLCQYNITHLSTGHNAAFCLRVFVFVLIGQIAIPYFFLQAPQKCEGCTVSLFSKVRSYGAEHLLLSLFLVGLLFSSMRDQIKVTTDISNLVTLTRSWKYSSHKTVIPSGWNHFLGCLNRGNIPVLSF